VEEFKLWQLKSKQMLTLKIMMAHNAFQQRIAEVSVVEYDVAMLSQSCATLRSSK